MEVTYARDRSFVAAGHEDARDPGVWKTVMFHKDDLRAGAVQMVNWARQPIGKRFARHYHEDMQEIFVIVQGVARLQVGDETLVLRRGDAVRIDPHEVHEMWNAGQEDVEYVVVGITSGAGGRTVVVGGEPASDD